MAIKNQNRRTKVQTKPRPLVASPFQRLSDGVILYIAEFLSPASKLAFRRSCRHIDSVIGTRLFRPADTCKAQGVTVAREPPWEVLELQYPNHLECYYCRDLHPIDKIHEYSYLDTRINGPLLQQYKCWQINHIVRTARFIHPDFNFTVFRIIMKHSRQGKSCKKLLKLLAYQSGAVLEGAQVKQIIITPKIVGERLLMRSQTTYVVPPKGPSLMYLLDRNLLKCPHTDRWSRDNTIVMERLFKRLTAHETVSRGRQENIMRCRCKFCPTEFQISLEQLEENLAMLFITKWQDLGTGLSPLFSDLPSVVGRRRNVVVAQKGERITYESPRDRFEGLAPGEDLRVVSTLTYEERKDLLRKSNSKAARFMRINNSAWWPIFGYGQPYPHLYASRGRHLRSSEEQ